MQNLYKTVFLAAILTAGSLQTAHALDSDRNQPISIEADQHKLEQKNKVTVFSRNAHSTQVCLQMKSLSYLWI